MWHLNSLRAGLFNYKFSWARFSNQGG